MNTSLEKLAAQMSASPWLDGEKAHIIHLTNENGMRISLMDIGATWLSCFLPIGEGREVLLRAQNMAEHIKQKAYLGATIGRYANRIAQGKFQIDNINYQIPVNNGPNSLHGGQVGFDKKRWSILEQTSNMVKFELISPDGEQGYPGTIITQVCYHLTHENQVKIQYWAQADKTCPVNLTNHAYFNLAGEGSDAKSLDHYLQIFAPTYLPTDETSIPTGNFLSTLKTGFDFNQPKQIRQDFLQDEDQKIAGGYDHSFLLEPSLCDGEKTVAQLIAPKKDVRMEVATTKPALQFYSGNFIDDIPSPKLGVNYQKYQGLALETQFLPDGPNHISWGKASGVLQANTPYQHQTQFKFIY